MTIKSLKEAVLGTPMAPIPVQPANWPQPKGYANGMKGRGTMLMTGGLVGWDETGQFPSGLVAQIAQTLRNLVTVLEAGGARPEHLMRMTWYVTDMAAYRASLREIGPLYREILGRHFPAMALVQVTSLVEPDALVEIESTAIIPEA